LIEFASPAGEAISFVLSEGMVLTDIMLEQLAVARGIVQAGRDLVPAWRIQTPEGPFLVLTKFDHDKPKQGARALHLLKRFMTWKMATSYVTTAQIWLGPDLTRKGPEALSVVGVSRNERRAAIQRVERKPLSFGEVEWLQPQQVDYALFALLPETASSLTHVDIMELEIFFGPAGEFAATPLS
jgi:hypothetical protein